LDGLMLLDRHERSVAEDIGHEPLLSLLVLEGLVPVSGSELEDAAQGPVRQEAEEVAQVSPRLDLVKLAAREQRDESRVDLAAVVATDEEPIFTSHGFTSELALAPIVMDGQAAVLEEALERLALIPCVTDRLSDGRLVEREQHFGICPLEEG